MKFFVTLALAALVNVTRGRRTYRQEEFGVSSLETEFAPSTVLSASIDSGCDGRVEFELITGFVYSSAEDIISNEEGTLKFTDCISLCRDRQDCRAVNFETGLCILFKTAAREDSASLAVSQMPVFTLYAQKVCLPRDSVTCKTPWIYETSPGLSLLDDSVRGTKNVSSRHDCALACLNEKEFECRAASFDLESKRCSLSLLNRHMGGRRQLLRMRQSSDLIEVSCTKPPQNMCEFLPTKGKILKTVDSVYQDVEDTEGCKRRCLEESFECHSFDFMSAGTKICRLSHHSSASISHIQEPYIQVENTTTYELRGCYEVSVECHAKEMLAKIKTTSVFDGKVYVKSRPNTCVVDVENSTSLDFPLPYNDVRCDVIQEEEGVFFTNIVIQHHDMIVTSSDVGLALHCKYDLKHATVTNSLQSGMEVKSGSMPEYVSETVVASPNVNMTITDRFGREIPSATVGDELALRFEIQNENSPYEIFVRDLVAMDGQDSSEIVLIDERGCPTDPSIMQVVQQVGSGKVLQSQFNAFKFPTSDVVQFRALISPCMPRCEPTVCSDVNVNGLVKESFGRKKRSIQDQSLLLAKSVRITDRFSFKESLVDMPVDKKILGDESCTSFTSLVAASVLFLLSQVVVLVVWSVLWHKKRATKQIEPMTGNLPPEVIYGTLTSRHTSTSRLTD